MRVHDRVRRVTVEVFKRGDLRDVRERYVWFWLDNTESLRAFLVCPRCEELRPIDLEKYMVTKSGHVSPEYVCCPTTGECGYKGRIQLDGWGARPKARRKDDPLV